MEERKGKEERKGRAGVFRALSCGFRNVLAFAYALSCSFSFSLFSSL